MVVDLREGAQGTNALSAVPLLRGHHFSFLHPSSCSLACHPTYTLLRFSAALAPKFLQNILQARAAGLLQARGRNCTPSGYAARATYAYRVGIGSENGLALALWLVRPVASRSAGALVAIRRRLQDSGSTV